MSNLQGYENLELDGEDLISELERTVVKTTGDQTITGLKTFENVIIHDLSVNSQTTFATEDGIIHQLKDNTASDLLDYGNYATYNEGGLRYKGIINKKGTDKFYVFHNQTTEPSVSLNLGSQSLGTLIVRNPSQDSEVASKQYVDTHSGNGNYLPISGGAMTGNINMGGKDVTNLYHLKFDNGQGVFNALIFRNNAILTLGSYIPGETDIDPFIHLNDSDSNKLIELMKDINLHGNISVRNSKRITGLQTPVGNSEPATKEYVDTHTGGNYLPLSGGTMTGKIIMPSLGRIEFTEGAQNITGGGTFTVINAGTKFIDMNNQFTRTNNELRMMENRISGLGSPLNPDDAVNRTYCDTKLSKTGGTMTGVLTVNNEIRIEQDRRLRFGPNNDNRIILDDKNELGIYSNNGYLVFRPNDILTDTDLNMGANDIINVNGITLSGDKTIKNLATPTSDNDAATKKYVDDKTVKYSNTLSLSVNNNSSYAYGIFNFENIPAGSNGNRPFVIDMFSSFSYSASGDDLLSISADIIYKNASGTQVGSTFSTGAAYNASKTIVNTRFITLINKDVFQFPPGAVECEVEILINSTAAISKSGRIIVTINDTNGL